MTDFNRIYLNHIFRGCAVVGAALALIGWDASSDSAETASDSASASGAEFTAGTFQLTTTEAKDSCLGGGLETLFMPDGAATPYDLANTTEFRAAADLPKTYNISLQAPFTEMDVTVEKGASDRSMQIRDSVQTDIVVNADSYGHCNVDMSIDADITVVDNDNINVTATILVTDWQGADMKCPMAQADPRQVTLTMTGKRQ
jgi:hypothetical protein